MKTKLGDIVFYIGYIIGVALGWRFEPPREYGNSHVMTYNPKANFRQHRKRR